MFNINLIIYDSDNSPINLMTDPSNNTKEMNDDSVIKMVDKIMKKNTEEELF